MIRRVEITRRAEKQARRLPARVSEKLWTWVYLVKEIGLEDVRAYRAMYRVVVDGDGELVSVEEVSKHGY